ncbi:serine/arginine-rich splicing factor 4-like isoform X2 [Scyliorhinus canicula]|uniref:serine/arginine-rich splicing factor 4-like isoform X2 n=1 Tax=Scyliorhinus canicula TaxID=7830 RepID=UPI0018F4765F|nr:serine/arginine-rich splicing factor 4-like isoform X2 [Scyliorhinus canicula]
MLDHDQEEDGAEEAECHNTSVIADHMVVEEREEVAVQFVLNTELLWKTCPPGLVGSVLFLSFCWKPCLVAGYHQSKCSFKMLNEYASLSLPLEVETRHTAPKIAKHKMHMVKDTFWQSNVDLKDLMRQAGEVTFVDAHRNKNEGVVEFATSSDMKNALNKLEGTEINGRKIRLIEDRKRRTRSRSHSRSSSRSRSRSPSPRQSKSESRSRSRSRSKSRSASRSPGRKDQPTKKAHSRSKSPSGLTNQSRSRSPSVESAD